MKKLTLSVAALTIAMMSYGQCVHSYQDSMRASGDLLSMEVDTNFINTNRVVNTIESQIHDLIDAIRMDVFYGYLEKQRGDYYIREAMKIRLKSKELL